MRLILLAIIILCSLKGWSRQSVIADFDIPDTVCVNTPVNITNTSTGASSYFWNFCVASVSGQQPQAVNLGNPGNTLALPVFTDIIQENGNFYVFVANHFPGGLVRLSFGNSLLNTPVAQSFGNMGGVIANNTEGIQVVKNEGKWYVFLVGGHPNNGPSRIVKIDFGTNINSNTPTATNWGNIGGLYHPMELHIFKEGNNWFGFTVNSENSTITRFSFGTSFENTPTGQNLGNIGMLNHPGGINVINDNGVWRAFVTNATSNTITRLDFGNSLANIPTGINLGNPGNALRDPRDIYVLNECGRSVAYVINGQPVAGFLQVDFNDDFSSIPVAQNYGNLGNMNFPHSISQFFRVGNDLYTFVPNAANNTITRLRFAGCTDASIPNSNVANPGAVFYGNPGVYNISLTIDDGLPTQSTICKKVVVVPSPVKRPIQQVAICEQTPVKLGAQTSLPGATVVWNNGFAGDSLTVTSAGTYWVEINQFGCVSRDSFNVVIPPSSRGTEQIAVCAQQSVKLGAQVFPNGSTLVWNNGVTGDSLTVTSSGIYWVEANVFGCMVRDSFVVTISPAKRKTQQSVICNAPAIRLGAQVFPQGVNLLWNTGATGDSITVNTPGTYWVEGTVPGCATIRDSFTVVMPPLKRPTPQITICNGSPIKLGAQQFPPGTLFIWSDGSSDDSLFVSETGTYWVEASILGCAVRDSFVVFIPPAKRATQQIAICSDSTIKLGTQVFPANTTLLWSNGLATDSITVNTSGIYWAEASVYGCIIRDSFEVSVSQAPAVNLGEDIDVCANNTIILDAGNQGAEFLWNTGAVTQQVQIQQSGEYSVAVSNGVCTRYDTVVVNITAVREFGISSPSSLCIGDTAQLTAAGGDIYRWRPDVSLSSLDVNNPRIFPQESTTYWVTIEDTVCERTAELSAAVISLSLPAVVASRSNDLDCSSNNSQLSVSGGVSYTWSPSQSLSNPDISNPIATPDTTTSYIVKGIGANGCFSYDTVVVKVTDNNKSNYLVPNAFTPNNDGRNDCFGIKFWGAVQEIEFSIYNRWGQLVFHSRDPQACWNGNFKGAKQDAGVYVYMIKARTSCESEVFRKGIFTLIR